MKKKENRGGARKGSGRKGGKSKRFLVSVKILTVEKVGEQAIKNKLKESVKNIETIC